MVEGNPTANRIANCDPAERHTWVRGLLGLGNVWQPVPPTQFGQSVEDLVFLYNDPVTQATVNGVIHYTGIGVINNLVLYVDAPRAT